MKSKTVALSHVASKSVAQVKYKGNHLLQLMHTSLIDVITLSRQHVATVAIDVVWRNVQTSDTMFNNVTYSIICTYHRLHRSNDNNNSSIAVIESHVSTSRSHLDDIISR